MLHLDYETSVPTEERFIAPLIKSPSQCPGTMRAATSGGRRLMLVMLGRPGLQAWREQRCALITPGEGSARARSQRIS